jgi:hypothetical protein
VARVRAQVRSYEIGTGTGILTVLQFPSSTSVSLATHHQHNNNNNNNNNNHHHHLSSGAGTIGQIMADVPNGLSLAHPKKKKSNFKSVKEYSLRQYKHPAEHPALRTRFGPLLNAVARIK